MQAMMNMLKAMGFDPEAMKENAKNLYDRFVALETKMEHVSDERIAAVEAEISALKEHFNLHEQEPQQVMPMIAAPEEKPAEENHVG